MQVDTEKIDIRVGSLVMWNRKSSDDYGCMGVVIEYEDETYYDEEDVVVCQEFHVLWADNDRCHYDEDDLWNEYIKVVKF